MYSPKHWVVIQNFQATVQNNHKRPRITCFRLGCTLQFLLPCIIKFHCSSLLLLVAKVFSMKIPFFILPEERICFSSHPTDLLPTPINTLWRTRQKFLCSSTCITFLYSCFCYASAFFLHTWTKKSLIKIHELFSFIYLFSYLLFDTLNSLKRLCSNIFWYLFCNRLFYRLPTNPSGI